MKYIGDPPKQEYRDLCGCVWKDGKRIHVCSEHRHKHGIRPEKIYPFF